MYVKYTVSGKKEYDKLRKLTEVYSEKQIGTGIKRIADEYMGYCLSAYDYDEPYMEDIVVSSSGVISKRAYELLQGVIPIKKTSKAELIEKERKMMEWIEKHKVITTTQKLPKKF